MEKETAVDRLKVFACIILKSLGKTTELLRLVGVLPEMRTELFPNRSLERYYLHHLAPTCAAYHSNESCDDSPVTNLSACRRHERF